MLKHGVKLDPGLLRDRDLTPAEKIVLAVIRSLSAKSGVFYMSAVVLAEDLGLAGSTVRRTLKSLESKGRIACLDRGGRGAGSTARFRLAESLESGKATEEGAESAYLKLRVLRAEGAENAQQVVELRTEDEQLLSLAFDAPSEKQRAAFFRALAKAREAGVPDAWIANALASPRTDPSPFRTVDDAVRKAHEIVRAATVATDDGDGPRQRFQDLRHLVEYVVAGGEHLPPSRVLPGVCGRDGGPLYVRAVVKAATEWPQATEPTGSTNDESRAPVGAEARP